MVNLKIDIFVTQSLLKFFLFEEKKNSIKKLLQKKNNLFHELFIAIVYIGGKKTL